MNPFLSPWTIGFSGVMTAMGIFLLFGAFMVELTITERVHRPVPDKRANRRSGVLGGTWTISRLPRHYRTNQDLCSRNCSQSPRMQPRSVGISLCQFRQVELRLLLPYCVSQPTTLRSCTVVLHNGVSKQGRAHSNLSCLLFLSFYFGARFYRAVSSPVESAHPAP
jgi:hypothetical protein